MKWSELATWGYISAIGSGIILISGLFYQWHKKHRRKKTVKKLGEFMNEARKLQILCAQPDKPPPQKELDELGKSLERFLSDSLGDRYIVRLHNSAGLPDNDVVRFLSSSKHEDIYAVLNNWLARLDEFITSLDK